MYSLRIGVCLALVGWMTADAHAQLGTYGAPDPISWSQDVLPEGSAPMVATRTTYISTADGAASTQNLPGPQTSSMGTMLSNPTPPVASAAGNGPTIMPEGGYMQNGGNCGTCSDCGWGNCGGGGCCSPWYASFDALYLTRNQPDKLFMSYQWGAPVNQGYFDNFNGAWGGQVTLGHRFGCCCDWAVEGTYWGLMASDSDGGPSCPGPIYGTPMSMGLVDILGTVGGSPNGNQSASDYFDNSPNHHIWREWEAENVEVNLVRNVCGGGCSCASVNFLVGFRWFRFQDSLTIGAQHTVDGGAYSGDWLYLNDFVMNDLVGVQAGFDASYRFFNCWKAFIRPEFGIYNNHMTLNYNMYAVSSATGQQFQASSSTYASPNYPVHATADGFAFLTQVDVGLDWQITRHISVQGGYRVVAATGIGLADTQVPFYGNDTQAIAEIDHNSTLVLGGAFAGTTVTW